MVFIRGRLEVLRMEQGVLRVGERRVRGIGMEMGFEGEKDMTGVFYLGSGEASIPLETLTDP